MQSGTAKALRRLGFGQVSPVAGRRLRRSSAMLFLGAYTICRRGLFVVVVICAAIRAGPALLRGERSVQRYPARGV